MTSKIIEIVENGKAIVEIVTQGPQGPKGDPGDPGSQDGTVKQRWFDQVGHTLQVFDAVYYDKNTSSWQLANSLAEATTDARGLITEVDNDRIKISVGSGYLDTTGFGINPSWVGENIYVADSIGTGFARNSTINSPVLPAFIKPLGQVITVNLVLIEPYLGYVQGAP